MSDEKALGEFCANLNRDLGQSMKGAVFFCGALVALCVFLAVLAWDEKVYIAVLLFCGLVANRLAGWYFRKADSFSPTPGGQHE